MILVFHLHEDAQGDKDSRKARQDGGLRILAGSHLLVFSGTSTTLRAIEHYPKADSDKDQRGDESDVGRKHHGDAVLKDVPPPIRIDDAEKEKADADGRQQLQRRVHQVPKRVVRRTTVVVMVVSHSKIPCD